MDGKEAYKAPLLAEESWKKKSKGLIGYDQNTLYVYQRFQNNKNIVFNIILFLHYI